MKNIVGKRFGRLVVLERAGRIKDRVLWLCKCDCGNTKPISSNQLLYKSHTKSCGCLAKEKRIAASHKMTLTPTYKSWSCMRERCRNKNHVAYGRYGGRGIKICEQWEYFENFLKDMGEKPSHNHSLGRISNDGDYEPGNCRWETRQEQANNTSRNLLIEHLGETHTAAEWARRLGLTKRLIYQRLARGWSTVNALIIPAKKMVFRHQEGAFTLPKVIT